MDDNAQGTARISSEERLKRVLDTDAVGVVFFEYSGTVIDANEKVYANQDDAVVVAPLLRKLSRDLRATSRSLRLRNVEVMKKADDVVGRCHDLFLRTVNSANQPQ